ncbi:MAG: hypothetical protein JW870_07955 [Candidatus Delongbacteria bacterium]|nr:hypothetical protein [Candidatus Delongbacteria bacterium]
MPKVSVEIKGCTECPNFRYQIDKGCFCTKIGFEEMVEKKTWPQFNKDFHSGRLFETIPDWCPIKE